MAIDTVGELLDILSKFDRGDSIRLSVDVSGDGDISEDEAGNRAFGERLTEVFDLSGEVTICASGSVNFDYDDIED